MDEREEDFAVRRNDDLGYPILVTDMVRRELRTFLRSVGDPRFAVLADERVLERADELTRGVRGRLGLVAFPLGERRKSLRFVERVLSALLALNVDRATYVVGVGGGVASDLFGFTASIALRGLPYVHVATTLVAMMDAAIGGKTGVDVAEGKNLAGTFADPACVLCDLKALRSLPYRHLREGLAEAVKHGVIAGSETFEGLEILAAHPFYKWPWETVVADSLDVKTAIVRDDRTERGARELLNLGHTFAHGIERATSYRVSHGAAVAIGLRAAGLLALRLGRFSPDEHLRVVTLLALLRLPMRLPCEVDAVQSAMQHDKKRRNGRLRFVLPRAIGSVEYGIEARPHDVRNVLQRCAQDPGDDEFR